MCEKVERELFIFLQSESDHGTPVHFLGEKCWVGKILHLEILLSAALEKIFLLAFEKILFYFLLALEKMLVKVGGSNQLASPFI